MRKYDNEDFSRIGMIEFDDRFSVPESQELIEEISHMCWGNINMDERKPYTYQDTLDMLKEFERKALAFDRFREMLENRSDEQEFWEWLEVLDMIHKEVDTEWEVSQ
ncbi:MAG: hypothetical protein Tp1100DCM51572_52 [Prokaryotic dsDNA virus sp.]|nr:MAG: hypothetical protein Tp1100DCM51572_52 [Prokaryotic dsDNA virus sp.]|tara:strand:- start:25113 stop:25433 length:321 start_codon:yes stop_codon:yes gene_type:complete